MADKMMRMAGRSERGIAKAIQTNENGNIKIAGTWEETSIEAVVPLNFKGKVKGDFTSNPNAAYIKNTTKLPATVNDYIGTETSDAGYGMLSEPDGTSVNTAGTLAGQYGQYIFRFDLLAHLKNIGVLDSTATTGDLHSQLSDITISLIGNGKSGTTYGATLRWFNASTQTTEVLGSNTSDTASEIKKTIKEPVTDNGKIHLAFSADTPSNGTENSSVYIDYVYIDVNVATKSERVIVKDVEALGKMEQMTALLEGIKNKPSTSLLRGLNIEDDTESPLSLTKDDEGKAVLRVVDAAPFAYNQATDRLKVETQDTGEKARIETVVNNEVVAAGALRSIGLSFTTEKEVWVIVQFNKNSWTLTTGSMYAGGASLSATLFPNRVNQTTTPTTNTPAVSLFLPLAPSAASGLSDITTMEQARQQLLAPGENTYTFKFTNTHTESGNLTLKIVRVF